MSDTATATSIGTKVVIGPVRFSYAYLNEPRPGKDGKKPKYEVSIIIPKKNKRDVEACKKAIEAAKIQGRDSLWKGKIPKDLKISFYDVDEKDNDDPAYANSFYFTARSGTKPDIVDKARKPIIEADKIYSGMWGYVSINFFPFDNESKGVGAGLQNIMKTKDDTPLAGKASAEEDFAELEIGDSDDDNEFD